MPRVKTQPVKASLAKGSAAKGGKAKGSAKDKAVNRVDKFVLSLFVVRRALALTYLAAFLSIAVQADGIFGCEGPFAPGEGELLALAAPFFPPGLLLQLLALCGAVLAAAGLLALPRAEEAALPLYGALWLAFAGCLTVAPALYSAVEDRLVLEFGVVGVLLAAADARNPTGTAASRGALQAGRALAAWLLFRAVFVPTLDRLFGECPAWRNLTALKDAYQLSPFIQQPTCWFLWIASEQAARAVTSLKLFIDLASLLVFVPFRAVSAPAAALQLLGFALSAGIANHGCSLLALTGVALALLDDSFHATFWSDGLRDAWGCPADGGEEQDAREEAKQIVESDNDEKDKAPEESELAIWMFFLYVLLGLLSAALAATTTLSLPRLPGFTGLVIPAACALVTLAAIVLRSRHALVALVGLLVCGAGLLQSVRDLRLEAQLPPAAVWAAEALERAHVAHMLGEPAICPSAEGRPDVYIQGAVVLKDSPVNAHGEKEIEWLDMSTRFLPNHADDNRPVVLQPYTPRLDAKLFQLAQEIARDPAEPVLPLWLLRLCRQLLLREGAVVGLMAGPLGGLAATIYSKSAADELYTKAPTPLPAVRVLRRRVLLDEDIHTNKWWNTTDWEVVFQTSWSEKFERLLQAHAKHDCVSTTFAWHEVPLAEATISLVVAALTWRLSAGG